MSPYLIPKKALRVAAVVFGILTAAVPVIQSRRGVSELARCRTITPDDTTGLDACHRIWAENSRHFFVSTKSARLPAPPAPNAPEPVPTLEGDQGRAR
jgi:hypothetical protein